MALFLFSSCNKWFDVTSSSEIRSENHYKNVKGYQQTLVGCYIGMGELSLYGRTLTWYGLEMLAHQYETSNDPNLSEIYAFNYKSKQWAPAVNATWEKAYNTIVNANDALANLDKNKGSLDPIDFAVLKGELLGVRAWLHFDLLRLFGYGNWAKRSVELNDKPTIPYVTGLSKDIPPQRKGSEIYQLLMADIKEAAALLKENDPLTKVKPEASYKSINADGFYDYRHLHINYYAIKALEARVHQWFGSEDSMKEALEAAREVIAFVDGGGVTNYFKTTTGFISSQNLKTDNYSLIQEGLFVIHTTKMQTSLSQHIVPDFTSTNALAFQILPATIQTIYEGINLDVRFSKLLHQNLVSSTKGYVSIKYLQRDLGILNKDRVSLVRIPEVYYIAAEALLATKGDAGISEALAMLQKVRSQRGISTPLVPTLTKEQVQEEIKKEYRKEFISEGVMFYLYKRLGIKEIPNLAPGTEMGDAQYVWPFPDFELQSGRRQ